MALRALSARLRHPPSGRDVPAPRARPRLVDMLLGKVATLIMAATALALGVATFAVLSRGMSLTRRPHVEAGLFLANLVVLLLLALALAGRLARVIAERRRGLAGARLHVRLVVLFSVVAVTPTIVVGVFAAVFFHLGIQIWFNDRVRTALGEAVQASRATCRSTTTPSAPTRSRWRRTWRRRARCNTSTPAHSARCWPTPATPGGWTRPRSTIRAPTRWWSRPACWAGSASPRRRVRPPCWRMTATSPSWTAPTAAP